MTPRMIFDRLRLLAVASLMVLLGSADAQAEEAQPAGMDTTDKPYNIILVITDQRANRLFAGPD